MSITILKHVIFDTTFFLGGCTIRTNGQMVEKILILHIEKPT